MHEHFHPITMLNSSHFTSTRSELRGASCKDWKSAFSQRLFIKVAGHFAERHFAERHFAESNRHFAESNGHFADGRFAEWTFCRTDIQLAENRDLF
jgi:hypothetical protein